MKTSKWFGAALAVLALSSLGSCKRESFLPLNGESQMGEVRISLAQDERITLITKADPTASELPPVDSFWIEIYKNNPGQSKLRLYRQQYVTAKDDVIKLNAGEFRLVASHGDSLGAGFNKPYYLADSLFTVHGFKENGNQPDSIHATAKLANVKLAVSFGENLQKYYSNYYAVVRNSAYPAKQVKFRKDETRHGYIPGGELYLEVFANLKGTGIQDGGLQKDSLVYFKSTPVQYDPNDFVTYTIDCREREGNLDVNILVDKEVTTTEQIISIPSSALPKDPPYFMFHGVKDAEFSYSFPVGVGAQVADATMTFTAFSGVASAVLQINNSYLTGTLGLPASVNLVDIENRDAATKTALNAAGITWYAVANAENGFVNVAGVLPALSIHSSYSAANPKVAAFTLTVVDNYNKQSTAVLNLNGEPITATVGIVDYNIWGWKLVDPYADFSGVNNVNPDADIRLQYSLDGSNWQSVTKKSVSAKRVVFNTPTGLSAGQNYHTRVIIGDSGDNYSAETMIKTEDPEQVLNNGFEEYTQVDHTVAALGGLGGLINIGNHTVNWWQLYSETGVKSWAVNSLVSMRTSAAGAGAYTDYKCYPTVALFTDGADSGVSVMVATIAEASTGSELQAGDYHVGELFIGLGNNLAYSDWAKVSEGIGFSNRPASLSFRYKFNANNAPYYVHVEVLDADGNIIGQGTKNDQSSSVNSWTSCTVPITYSITNRKAGGIKLSFMSCRNASDKGSISRRITVNTLSGSHTIHPGNILYLDNVEMLYQ